MAQHDVLQEMVAAQEKILQHKREVDIALTVSRFKGASTKRNLKFIMTSLDKLEDMRNLFPADLEEEFITSENTNDFEKAIEKFCDLYKELKDHLSHEKNMQIAAATSPLGWKTVHQIESEEVIQGSDMLSKDFVREAEAKSMKHARELRTAKNFKEKEKEDRFKWRSGRGGKHDSRREREREPYGTKDRDYRGGSRYRGGRFRGGRDDGCYNCGDPNHHSYQNKCAPRDRDEKK